MPAIKLEYPFEHDGTTYTEIEVDNPTLGDIRYAQNLAKSCDDAIEAFASVAGQRGPSTISASAISRGS